jgi:50S ribosomal subunit-associated GTPase HflX
VDGILADLPLQDTPRLWVLNKSDLLDAAATENLLPRFPEAVLVSARLGHGLDALVERIVGHMERIHRSF